MAPKIEKKAEYVDHEYTVGNILISIRENKERTVIGATLHMDAGKVITLGCSELQILISALEKHGVITVLPRKN
jgi:hypothetical protein